MAQQRVTSKVFVTPVFRVSYPQLDEPQGFTDVTGTQTNPKYSLMAVWRPEGMDAAERKRWDFMRAEFDRVSKQAFKLPLGKLPKNVRTGLREGNERPNEAGDGAWFATLSSSAKYKPGIVNRSKEAIDPNEVYAGCYARASIQLFAFDNVGKGIGVGLRNLQKVADGERLDGATSASDDFSDESDDLPEIEGAFDSSEVDF